MRAISPVVGVLGIVLCGYGVLGQTNTNATIDVTNGAPTRVWISSFDPIVLATDHQLDIPRPCTPWIPKALGRDWQTNYDAFSKLLVTAAAKADLDSESLAKMLRMIWDKNSKGLAILPVEADFTWRKGEPVWDIQLRWEYTRDLGEGDMIHICSYMFSRKTFKMVYQTSCD